MLGRIGSGFQPFACSRSSRNLFFAPPRGWRRSFMTPAFWLRAARAAQFRFGLADAFFGFIDYGWIARKPN